MPNATASKLLTLDVEQKGSTYLVHCHGRLIAGVCNVLYDQVHELIPGSTRIVLDLTDLAFVDSMGLGTLVRLYVSARGRRQLPRSLSILASRFANCWASPILFQFFGDMCEKGITPRF